MEYSEQKLFWCLFCVYNILYFWYPVAYSKLQRQSRFNEKQTLFQRYFSFLWGLLTWIHLSTRGYNKSSVVLCGYVWFSQIWNWTKKILLLKSNGGVTCPCTFCALRTEVLTTWRNKAVGYHHTFRPLFPIEAETVLLSCLMRTSRFLTTRWVHCARPVHWATLAALKSVWAS